MLGELDGEPRDYDLFVDGESVSAAAEDRIDIEFPYDGTVWATVPAAGTADIDAAVEAARTAFEDGWANSPPSTRRAVLHQIADVVEAHAEELT